MTKPNDIVITKLPNYSDKHHTSDGHFVNEQGDPCPPPPQEPKKAFSGAKQFFKFATSGSDVIAPMPIREIKKNSPDFQLKPGDSNIIRVWWLGHPAVLIRINNKYIITDPMLSLYASPVSGFIKRITPAPIAVENLPPISIILYSHDHYDHLSYDTLTKLKDLNPNVKILCPVGVHELINGWNPRFYAMPFDWRTTTTIDDITFTCFPSRHFSRRSLTDTATKLWVSWLIQYKDVSIYFAGDTAIGPHFQEVRNFVGKPIDLALMPIGPQNPPEMMRAVHLNPQDVKDMSDILEAKVVIPIHYGTFALGSQVETPDLVLLRQCWTGFDNLLPLITGGYAELNMNDSDKKFGVNNENEMLQPNE
ncbi:hypothetical protein M9Y10_005738 [Tritrichomonas musculus]|uniref:Metallo-beta-lactamase domain-containing protein n=1 Tax=Tritrichomonas musculus TaxID=1915356 RepID=A0ABR2JCH1_9EUKA